jgi:hypothetical protein
MRLACPTSPFERLARPQQPALSSRTRQPAISSSSTAARPIRGSVNVVNESASSTTSPRGAGGGRRGRRASPRISVSRSKRGRGRRPAMPTPRSSSGRAPGIAVAQFDTGASAAPTRLRRRIAPNTRERSGMPWMAW